MRAVWSWVREFCDVEVDVEEAAERLTRVGAAVEAIHRPWEGVRGVRIARVVEKGEHPDSDRLVLATLETGERPAHVAAGARNFEVGDMVVHAPPGSRVASLDKPLAVRRLRGVESEGMMCSEHELAVSSDHGGILVLPPDAPLGADFLEWAGLAGDAVLELELEPNRPDLLSMAGVARELAAAVAGGRFRPPATATLPETDEPASGRLSVTVDDPERCPHYLVRVVAGVSAAARSPVAVRARLSAAGMRPLSAIVDATNYAMLELGQPLHPFDLARLEGPAIAVRRAAAGEPLTTLDGQERTLDADDLVIADRDRAVAVAGVMGGEAAEVGPGTADIAIESAHFAAAGVFRTAQRLGLRTEASIRFAGGADPEAVPAGAARAAELISAWAGGSVLAGAVERGAIPARRSVALRPSRASLLIGYPVTGDEAAGALARLGLERQPEPDPSRVLVEIPGHRPDLEREIDLIEEVARVLGYERVPTALPRVRQVGRLSPLQSVRWRVRDVLAGAGLLEARSLSFVGHDGLDLYGPKGPAGVRLANPMSDEAAFLRTGLLPGLLAAAGRNVAVGAAAVRLFELGNVVHGGGELPEEHESVAVLVCGARGSWSEPARPVDFFDASGILETLLASLGVNGWALGRPAGPPFHPARSAVVSIGDRPVGAVGELHPRPARAHDLPGRVAAFELDLASLAAAAGGRASYRPVSRFPRLHRDLAFVVDAGVRADDVRAAVVSAAGDLVESIGLFDVFSGPPIAEGRKSLAFSVDFRAERTLTDAEVDGVVGRIVERLARDFGAELRAG